MRGDALTMNLDVSSNWLKWDLTLQHATSSVPSFRLLNSLASLFHPPTHTRALTHTRTPMYRRRFKKKQETTFPDTIEGFGYVVKENGEIRHKEKGTQKATPCATRRSLTVGNADEKYEFEYIPKDRPYNEARYNAFISKLFILTANGQHVNSHDKHRSRGRSGRARTTKRATQLPKDHHPSERQSINRTTHLHLYDVSSG